MNDKMTVATTILQQLGGRQFVAMTGCKTWTMDANSLTLKIPGKTKNQANRMKVTLMADDLYWVVFSSVRGTSSIVKGDYPQISCDYLRTLFEDATGLRTIL